MNKKNLILKGLVISILSTFPIMLQSNGKMVLTTIKSISKLTKSNKALSPEKMDELVKLLQTTKGTKKVGKTLGKMNLPKEVLEDTYMRLAVYKKVLSKREAKEMFFDLKGTKGFRTTLRKTIGNSSIKTSGHLNELKIAHSASRNGFKVRSIGETFVDGIKKSPTDLDIVLTRKGKTFTIEAKDYASTTNLPLDKFRGDMDTLISYAKQNRSEKVIPIFSMTNKPSNSIKLKQLQKAAEKRNVQLIFGTPGQQIEQIKLLGDIL